MKKIFQQYSCVSALFLSGCNSGTSSSGMKESNDSTTVNQLSGVYVASKGFRIREEGQVNYEFL